MLVIMITNVTVYTHNVPIFALYSHYICTIFALYMHFVRKSYFCQKVAKNRDYTNDSWIGKLSDYIRKITSIEARTLLTHRKPVGTFILFRDKYRRNC
jgi:hypothetical protein